MNMTESLNDIWERILAGETNAWAVLVKRYAPLVYSEARKFDLPEHDAEDCAQHSWIALYRKRHSINDPQAIPAWLIRTTRRQAAAMMRQLRASRMTSEESALVERSPGPDEQAEQQEFDSLIRAAIEELDPRCQSVIHQLYLANQRKSYAEIGRSLGLNANSLGPLRSRCLARLRKILQEKGLQMN